MKAHNYEGLKVATNEFSQQENLYHPELTYFHEKPPKRPRCSRHHTYVSPPPCPAAFRRLFFSIFACTHLLFSAICPTMNTWQADPAGPWTNNMDLQSISETLPGSQTPPLT